MTFEQIIEAREAAKAFLKAVKELEANTEMRPNQWSLPGNRYTGDVRRKSMDLTRALADLRKPWAPKLAPPEPTEE